MEETNDKGGVLLTPSNYVLGIDLGTTNSSVAIYSKGMQVLPLEGDRLSLPSVVRFSDRNSVDVQVGSNAKKYIITKPMEVFSSFKTLMTDSQWTLDSQLKDKYCIKGIQYTPTDMAYVILDKIRETVQMHRVFGQSGTICKAVICVPAQSQPSYIDNVYVAAEKAGFGLKDRETGELLRDKNGHVLGVKILEEPTAASIAYGLKENFFGGKMSNIQHILVYDLGGGTFDVTLLKIESIYGSSTEFDVINKDGVGKLGGDDFDWDLVDLLCLKLSKEAGFDILASENNLAVKTILKDWAENAKIDFSNGDAEVQFNKPLELNGKNISFDIVVRKDDFIAKIKPRIEITIQTVKGVLGEVGMSIGDINRIVLVGGSCKGPWIREAIKEAFDREPYSADNVDTIIAAGASYYGSDLIDVTKPESDFDDSINDTLGFNYGFELESGVFSPMLIKGEKFVNGIISHTRKFTNATENGVLCLTGFSNSKKIEVEAGEAGLSSGYSVHAVDHNGNKIFTWIGEYEVQIPLAPVHTLDIELTMTASKDKTLRVTGTVNGEQIATESIEWKY